MNGLAQVDDVKTTVCADSFVTLLEAVTERYQLLPVMAHKLRFFDEIQCRLLDTFLDDLETLKTQMAKVFGKFDYARCCKLLNSASYCREILLEWGDEVVSISSTVDFLFVCYDLCFVCLGSSFWSCGAPRSKS